MKAAGGPEPSRPARTADTATAPHLACPFCGSYDVERLFVASARLDMCECRACSARWDEDSLTGEYRGRADRSSVLMPRNW